MEESEKKRNRKKRDGGAERGDARKIFQVGIKRAGRGCTGQKPLEFAIKRWELDFRVGTVQITGA